MLRKTIFALATLLALCTPSLQAATELPPDQAFNLQARIVDGTILELYWEIAPQHYMYKNQFVVLNQDNVSLLKADTLPKAETIHDPDLGNYEVYTNSILLTLPWSDVGANRDLIVRYQGCAKDGFCYFPINKELSINAKQEISIQDTNLTEFAQTSVTDQFSKMIQHRFLPLTLLIFFGLGILLSFTPCVLPMIPLVVNLILGPKKLSTHKALLLSSTYVAGMATSYTAAGVLAGMLGETLQAWLQQPIVIIGLSLMLVLLALSQFEVIHIRLPHFNKRLHHWGAQQLQGSFIGAFILGALAALIVSPCITPPLIGALTYISQDGNPFIGGLILLSLALGMGLPLIVVAMLSSIILPKAGEWMNFIKSVAGLALLGLAIWLVQRLLPDFVGLIMWGLLCLVTAVYCNVFETLKSHKLIPRLVKAGGILIALFGAGIIMQAINQAYTKTTPATQSLLNWQPINSVAELNQALALAKQQHKVTMLEFSADWCVNCKQIEATVFTDPAVAKKLQSINLLRIDLTDIGPNQKQLLHDLDVFGPPTLVFFTANGQEARAKRVVGEVNAKLLLTILNGL